MLRLFLFLLCAELWPARAAMPPDAVTENRVEVVQQAQCFDHFAVRLLWDRSVPVWGGRVYEDLFATTEAKYVNPNEHNHHSLKPYLTGIPGVYVGVGSFRVLNIAVMAGFEDIVMLDYDLGTVAFNRLNLELIATAQDRYEYLHLLFYGTRQAALLTEVRSGQITEDEFVWRISRFPTGGKGNLKLKQLNLALPPFSMTYAYQIAAATEAPGYQGRVLTPPRDIFHLFDQERFQVNEWVHRVALWQKIPEIWGETYLGSDLLFRQLQKLIRRGHVHVLCGDLAGETALRDLAGVLTRAKKTVGVFDASNAPEWFEDSPDLARRARYFANLRQMPWSDKGVLLTTGGFTQIQTERWGQSLISHRHLNEMERLTVTKPVDARASGWKSAHDKIFLPGGPGTAKPNSIFVWQ